MCRVLACTFFGLDPSGFLGLALYVNFRDFAGWKALGGGAVTDPFKSPPLTVKTK